MKQEKFLIKTWNVPGGLGHTYRKKQRRKRRFSDFSIQQQYKLVRLQTAAHSIKKRSPNKRPQYLNMFAKSAV